MKLSAGWLVLAFLLAGCVVRNTQTDTGRRVQQHMDTADSLEVSGKWSEALLEYKLLVELYPQSEYHAMAVRNIALLYTTPLNPSMDDSLARQWWHQYLLLDITPMDRITADTYLTLLDRIANLKTAVSRQENGTDSLRAKLKQQSSELGARNKRIGELESELNQTKEELRKIREVDVLINKRKGKK